MAITGREFSDPAEARRAAEPTAAWYSGPYVLVQPISGMKLPGTRRGDINTELRRAARVC